MEQIAKKIIQFAVVSPNTDDTVSIINECLNIGPCKVWDFKHPAIFNTTILDQNVPWTMKLAFGWLGNMQFEVIEPTGGQSLYQAYLDKWKKPGVQHLLIDRGSNSYSKMKELLAQLGTPIVNEAKTNVAVQLGPFTLPPLPMFLAKSMATVFGYTSTLDTLKIVIETSKYPPGVTPRTGIKMGVPNYWSAGDKKNFEILPENSLITDIEGFIIFVKNIEEVKPHYEKLFGKPTTLSSTEFFFQLETNIIKVVQPITGTTYENILSERGEGVQVLIATPRTKNKQVNDEIFAQKGFQITNLNDHSTLYTNVKMPFQIQINL